METLFDGDGGWVEEKDHDDSKHKKHIKNQKLGKADEKDRLLKRIINGYCQWLLIKWERRQEEKRKSFQRFFFDYERIFRVPGSKVSPPETFRITNLYILCLFADKNGHFNDLFILVFHLLAFFPFSLKGSEKGFRRVNQYLLSGMSHSHHCSTESLIILDFGECREFRRADIWNRNGLTCWAKHHVRHMGGTFYSRIDCLRNNVIRAAGILQKFFVLFSLSHDTI